MTCIIAADGMMVADSRITGYHIGTCTKLFTHKGSIYGCAGDAVAGAAFEDWIRRGAQNKNRAELVKLFETQDVSFAALELCPDGSIAIWEYPWFRIPIDSPIYAIGSGSAYALGAHSAGADLEEAVRIAARWDEGCNTEVVVATLADAEGE